MCVIIDACVFTKVFRENDVPEARFKPLYDWIRNKGGKMIVGGTTYLAEIKGSRCLGLFTEFGKLNKLVVLPSNKVDRIEADLKTKETSKKFDDAHLVAMVVASRCCVVCTDEKKAVKFFERKDFYPRGVKPPKIYRNKTHQHLCCDDNVVKVCRDDKEKKSRRR